MKHLASLFLILFTLIPSLATAAALPTRVDALTATGAVSAGSMTSTGNVISTGGSIAAGTATPDSKAVLDLVSTTKGMLPPRLTTAQRDAIASPPEGLVIFNTDTNTLNQYTGTAWSAVGSGAGGINHISNYDGEADTTGHTLYADAAATSPVDGTGGSSSLTLSKTTTNGEVLRGNGSYEIAKSAANEQGEGVGINFSVALADYNPPQMQTIEFNYKASANFDYGSGTAADPSDIVVYIYARDSGTLIQPSTYQLDGSGKFLTQFQPLTTDDDYRLILHVAGTNALAWDFFYDEIKVGPTNFSRGPPVTAAASYTPTLTTSGGGNITLNATAKTDPNGWWYRNGQFLHGQATFRNGSGGAASGSAGTVQLGLPSAAGCTIDTASMATAVGGVRVEGDADTGTTTFTAGNVYANSTTTLAIMDTGASSYLSVADLAASFYVAINYKVPCLGWGTTSATSNDDGRPVVLRATNTSTQSGVTDKVIPINVATRDSHSMLNTSTGLATVKVSGDYFVYARTLLYSVDASNNSYVVINKNAVEYGRSFCSAIISAATTHLCQISEIVSLNAGDTIGIYVDGDASFDIDSNSGRNNFTMERIGAYGTVSASESVTARAYLAANQTGVNPNGTYVKINFDTRDDDSHGRWSTSNYRYDVGVSGVYDVFANVQLSSTNTLANRYAVEIRKNGSRVQFSHYWLNSSATSPMGLVGMAPGLRLASGDYIEIYLFGEGNNSVSTLTVLGGSGLSSVSIKKVGN